MPHVSITSARITAVWTKPTGSANISTLTNVWNHQVPALLGKKLQKKKKMLGTNQSANTLTLKEQSSCLSTTHINRRQGTGTSLSRISASSSSPQAPPCLLSTILTALSSNLSLFHCFPCFLPTYLPTFTTCQEFNWQLTQSMLLGAHVLVHNYLCSVKYTDNSSI